MGKSKRATRKELEEVIASIIDEMQKQAHFLQGLNGLIGEYIKFKGDTISFNDFLKKELDKQKIKITEEAEKKDVKSAKKDRYKKVSMPPL